MRMWWRLGRGIGYWLLGRVAAGVVTCPFFCLQLYLSDTRLMDPRHGAWLSPDPLGYVDSPNLYAYARQNPIDFVDPSGLYNPLYREHTMKEL